MRKTRSEKEIVRNELARKKGRDATRRGRLTRGLVLGESSGLVLKRKEEKRSVSIRNEKGRRRNEELTPSMNSIG